jgi:hypothetical protein
MIISAICDSESYFELSADRWRSNSQGIGSKISLKEGISLLEERLQLCVDYVFLTTLQHLLHHLREDLADDPVYDHLVELIFENLKPSERF